MPKYFQCGSNILIILFTFFNKHFFLYFQILIDRKKEAKGVEYYHKNKVSSDKLCINYLLFILQSKKI